MEDFSVDQLETKVKNGQIEEAKSYVKQFFFKLKQPVAIANWNPSQNNFTFYSWEDCKKLYLPKSITNGSFSIQRWFFQEDHDLFFTDVAPNEEKYFTRKGSKYINLFKGYRWTVKKNFNDFSQEIKDRCERVWKHVEEVWCSKNKSQFEYAKSYIAHMVAGRKMRACLYLKSLQGTGKSIIIDFIREMVIGRAICHETNNPSCVYGGFNAQLLGIIFLILEEVPCDTKGQWNSLYNAMKHMISSHTQEITKKGIDTVTFDNNISCIVLTNNNALKLEFTDRRIVALDISNDRIGDFAYFNKLGEECIESEEVGEAFYWFCREWAELHKDFKENVLPVTETKKEIIVDNLHTLYKFIKDNYVLQNKGIKQTFKHFYEDYSLHLIAEKMGRVTNVNVSKLLTQINIPVVAKSQNIKHIDISKEDLLKIYKDRKWIVDIDEFEPKEEEDPLEFGIEPETDYEKIMNKWNRIFPKN